MSSETPVNAKTIKVITDVISDVLKKCALQTVNVIETTSAYIKYDRDIYHHSGLDLSKAGDRKTAIDICRSKKDPGSSKGADGKEKKIIIAERISRKAVLTFNNRLKQMLCAVFVQYSKELAMCINECNASEDNLSLKKDHAINSLLEMARNSVQVEEYHYLPLMLTMYKDNIVNTSNKTTLTTLKSSIERSKSALGDILLDAYDNLFVNHGEIKDMCVESYLYLIALFSMETVTRVWVEAKIPSEEELGKKSSDGTSENTTKLISTKTVDLNAYKTFMLNKMQNIDVCSNVEYNYIIFESDAIVANIEKDLEATKAEKKVDKLEQKANKVARAATNVGKSVKKTARDDDDDAVPPGADPESDDPGSEEEEEEEEKPKPKARSKLGNRGGR
jgi:hypothetical protein